MPFDGAELFPSTSRPFASASRRRLRPLFEPQHPEIALLVPPDPATAALCLLEAARRMIEDERDWVRGAYTTASGKHCAMGALREAAWNFGGPSVLCLAHLWLLRVAKAHGFHKVERMNDCSTHADVRAAFDEAIAAARRATHLAA